MTRPLFVLMSAMVVAGVWSCRTRAAEDDQEVRVLRAQNSALRATVEQRNKEILALKQEMNALKAEIASLQAEPAARKAEDTKKAAKVPQEPSAPSREVTVPEAAPGHGAESIESPVTLQVGDGELRVRFQFTTLYIPASPPKEARLGYTRFLFVTYRESGGQGFKKPVEGHFRVNGRAEKVTVRSTNEKVLSITAYGDDYGLTVSAVGPGSANISVSLAGKSVSIPMMVVAIPVNGGGFRASVRPGESAHTKDEVIKLLGLPDERVERYLSWPSSAWVDGILYSAADPDRGVRIEHWKYKTYPGAVISFTGTRVNEVRSVQQFEVAE